MENPVENPVENLQKEVETLKRKLEKVKKEAKTYREKLFNLHAMMKKTIDSATDIILDEEDMLSDDE
jgi:chaperonin cofactor prefoldin